MEENKERQWPPVRRQKKVPKWQRLLRKYWPPIRLGLLILAAVLVIWLCIAGIGKLFGGIGKEKDPEVTEPTEYVPTEEEIQQMAEELLQDQKERLSNNQLKYTIIIISSLPMLIAYPYFQKFFVKGVMMGSLKE